MSMVKMTYSERYTAQLCQIIQFLYPPIVTVPLSPDLSCDGATLARESSLSQHKHMAISFRCYLLRVMFFTLDVNSLNGAFMMRRPKFSL